MSKLWMPRLIAGVFAIFAVTLLQLNVYVSIMLLLSVSHTILATYYSYPRFENVFKGGAGQRLALTVLLLISFYCIYRDALPMYYLILFHHVLNEVYTTIEIKDESKNDKYIFSSFLLFETLVFLNCSPLEFSYAFFKLNTDILFILQIISYLTICYFIFRSRIKKTAFFTFVSLGMAFSSFSYFVHTLNIDFLIIYHFTFWLVFPALKTWTITNKFQTAYWGQTFILMIIFLPFTLIFPNDLSYSVNKMSYITRVLAYFHIFTTLAVSPSNPLFVKKFFEQKTT